MNLSKRCKREDSNNTDDDVIILEPSTTSALSLPLVSEFCQHLDQTTGQSCREYYSVMCIHCHLYLCYAHVEIHRILLMNERDQLINKLNERIDELSPDQIKTILYQQWESRNQKKVSFSQRLTIEHLIDWNKVLHDLKELFQPIRILLEQRSSVSLIQIKKIKESLIHFDENKQFLFNQFIDSIPTEQTHPSSSFHLSKLAFPCREYHLPVERSSYHEIAASEDLLLINDREHLILFTLTDHLDENSIPELIEWKNDLQGKILDIHYSCSLKLFLILTDKNLFSFTRPSSSLICIYRFIALPWSCTTLLNSIYVLFKSDTTIMQYTFEQMSSTIQIVKQWKIDEILSDSEHDQHLRCIRANPSQTQLAILIENDECRWRIAIFDGHMNFVLQTDTLPNASTINWNLLLSFLTDQQILVIDATTENIYLVTIDEYTSSIEYKNHATNSDYPVNACAITNNGCSQLILKIVKPNKLQFFQI